MPTAKAPVAGISTATSQAEERASGVSAANRGGVLRLARVPQPAGRRLAQDERVKQVDTTDAFQLWREARQRFLKGGDAVNECGDYWNDPRSKPEKNRSTT